MAFWYSSTSLDSAWGAGALARSRLLRMSITMASAVSRAEVSAPSSWGSSPESGPALPPSTAASATGSGLSELSSCLASSPAGSGCASTAGAVTSIGAVLPDPSSARAVQPVQARRTTMISHWDGLACCSTNEASSFQLGYKYSQSPRPGTRWAGRVHDTYTMPYAQQPLPEHPLASCREDTSGTVRARHGGDPPFRPTLAI